MEGKIEQVHIRSQAHEKLPRFRGGRLVHAKAKLKAGIAADEHSVNAVKWPPINSIFPGPLKTADYAVILNSAALQSPSAGLYVSSGSSALRLFIKSLKLKKGSRIAVPALICSSVSQAILAEGMIPDYTDVSPGNYFMHFDEDAFNRAQYDMIVLPHMYGILHPQSRQIMAFAEEKKIPLIHDAAQSYGVLYQGKPIVDYNQGGFYSFGAGKATTAASGGWAFGLSPEIVHRYRLTAYRRIDIYGTQFLRQRCGLPYCGFFERIPRLSFRASEIQVKSAQHLLAKITEIEYSRLIQWRTLRAILPEELYGENSDRFSYYKYVFIGKPEMSIEEFQSRYKLKNPIRKVARPLIPVQGLPNYHGIACEIYEVSTETAASRCN